jgi:tRNA A-37 threonylcarbamoyl transferase component Bud32
MTTNAQADASKAAAPTPRHVRRQRRPSGAPPPLPRKIGFLGTSWIVATAALLVWAFVALNAAWALRVTDRVDSAILRQIARVRTDWLTDVFDGANRLAMGWTMTIVAIVLIVALTVFRRWRHLFTFVGSVLALELLGEFLYDAFARQLPYDVTTIGLWRGFSFPSVPVAVLTFLVVGIVYTLVVPGRPRAIATAVAGALVILLSFARLYLGVDHPFDTLVGVALPVAILLNAFRFFTPNEVFPVSYGGGKTAHLDVGGRRGEAIRRAVEDQLGVTLLDIKPVGLAESGGSTPLRLRAAGEPNLDMFGKLYAMNHVRADRWYKLGRTIRYGRLEDEAPFQSVRRLVQYEDYALRLVRDSGIPTATPYGVVELTPEREYLLVTEFLEGAQEISGAVVDDGVIDEGLTLIRKLWDSGLAHRDIKPANLLVRNGHLFLVDVAFVQVRPSPWRQAVDLANMMLVLAVRTDAERVHDRALQFFTPDDIAEAFAAARGIASPTQLRTAMKEDGRNLVGTFRSLAPARKPISLQRWNARRILLTIALLLGVLVGAQATFQLFTPAELRVAGTPNCGTGNLMILTAQAVPSATAVPCIASLPAGWKLGGVYIRQHKAQFWLDSDRGGPRAVDVTLHPAGACVVTGATEVPSDQAGARRFERPERLPPDLRSTRYYLLEGGCVVYRFAFHGAANASLMFAAESALAFQPRAELVQEVRERAGLRLCGTEAPPCPGGS